MCPPPGRCQCMLTFQLHCSVGSCAKHSGEPQHLPCWQQKRAVCGSLCGMRDVSVIRHISCNYPTATKPRARGHGRGPLGSTHPKHSTQRATQARRQDTLSKRPPLSQRHHSAPAALRLAPVAEAGVVRGRRLQLLRVVQLPRGLHEVLRHVPNLPVV